MAKDQQSIRSSMEPSIPHHAYHSQPLTSFTSVNFQTMHLQSLHQIFDDVTCHVCVKSWRVRKEKTALANEHIGHYKACAGHPQLSWLTFFQFCHQYLSHTKPANTIHKKATVELRYKATWLQASFKKDFIIRS
jgi:hypothetical protein